MPTLINHKDKIINLDKVFSIQKEGDIYINFFHDSMNKKFWTFKDSTERNNAFNDLLKYSNPLHI